MKTRTQVWGGICALMATCHVAALTAGPAAASAGKESKAVTLEDRWSLPGTFGGGVKTTGDYTDGNLFLVVPLHSSLGREGILGGDVLFLEPYTSWGERREVAASLGLGWRHLFNDQSVTAITRHDGHQASFMEEGWYVGGNIFVDMLDTEADNQFWQLGFGIEAGTRYLEVRGNYYLPLSDRQLAEEIRTRETFTSTSTRTIQSTTPLNQPFATGNTIQQDALFTTRRATTTSTTTIERLFQRFEDGMEGWDAEVAVLVPGLDKYCDLKLIGGYFKFDNQPFGPQTGGTGNVEGWKAGVELRPVPALVLTATWYEDERFVGDDWLFGLRMELPFEMGDLGDGKTFWKRISDSFRPRRRHLAERLAEPVHRQNAAIKVASTVEEAAAKASTKVKTATKIVSQTARRLVLKEDLVFANNGPATGNGIQEGASDGDGTAEHPQNTIQGAADIAMANSNTTHRTWNVYTQGTSTPYHENVAATTGDVIFTGSGESIPGVGNTQFGVGGAPQVKGGFYSEGIGLFGLIAYDISCGLSKSGDGVKLVNVETFIIGGNTFHSLKGNGVHVKTDDDAFSAGVIMFNTFEDICDELVLLESKDCSELGVILLGNQFIGGHDAQVSASSKDRSEMALFAFANEFSGGSEDAFKIRSYDCSILEFHAELNVIADAGGDGFSLRSKGDSKLKALITNNQINNVLDDGIGAEAKHDSFMKLTIERNTFSGAGNHYVEHMSFDDAFAKVTVNQNTFNSADNDAIHVEAHDSSFTKLVADANIIRYQGSYGIFGSAAEGARLKATITNNVIGNTILDGISLHASGCVDFTITGNVLENLPTGISVRVYGDGHAEGTIADNLMQGSLGTGLAVYLGVSDPTADIRIEGNTIVGASADGINLDQSSGSLNISGDFSNTITGFGLNALSVSGSPTGSIIINGITVSPPVTGPPFP